MGDLTTGHRVRLTRDVEVRTGPPLRAGMTATVTSTDTERATIIAVRNHRRTGAYTVPVDALERISVEWVRDSSGKKRCPVCNTRTHEEQYVCWICTTVPDRQEKAPCTECDGNGETYVRNDLSRGVAPSRGDLYDPVPCEHCHGTGYEPCEGCGEAPAVYVVEWTDPAVGRITSPMCAGCAAEMRAYRAEVAV